LALQRAATGSRSPGGCRCHRRRCGGIGPALRVGRGRSRGRHRTTVGLAVGRWRRPDRRTRAADGCAPCGDRPLRTGRVVAGRTHGRPAPTFRADLAAAPLPDGRRGEGSAPVSPADQRAALDAVLGTLSPDQLRVPPKLLPLLSAARNGSANRQYSIELFAGAGGTVFDPLVAADGAATLTLDALLAPARLARLDAQHAVDPKALGVAEVLDRLLATTLPDDTDALTRRIAYRTLVTLAQMAHDPATTPGVAALLDERVHETALALARRHGSAADRAWASSLSRQLLDPRQLDKLLATHARSVEVPPGAPIGSEADWMGMPGED